MTTAPNDRRANGPAALLMNEVLDHLDAGMSGADAWRTALRLPPRSKTAAYSELKARALRAAEAAVSNAPQPAPRPAARPVVPQTSRPRSGFIKRPEAAGWDRDGLDPVAVARELALKAKRSEPQILKASDTRDNAELANAMMRLRNQSTDPKSKGYSENMRNTLLELSERA